MLGSEELDDLLTGLRSNRLLKYSYILTGMYVRITVCVRHCVCMRVPYVNLWYVHNVYICITH